MINLQYLRLDRRFRQADLARLSGIPQPTISLIETGRLIPNDDELERLARVLGVPNPRALMNEVVVDLDARVAAGAAR